MTETDIRLSFPHLDTEHYEGCRFFCLLKRKNRILFSKLETPICEYVIFNRNNGSVYPKGDSTFNNIPLSCDTCDVPGEIDRRQEVHQRIQVREKTARERRKLKRLSDHSLE